MTVAFVISQDICTSTSLTLFKIMLKDYEPVKHKWVSRRQPEPASLNLRNALINKTQSFAELTMRKLNRIDHLAHTKIQYKYTKIRMRAIHRLGR